MVGIDILKSERFKRLAANDKFLDEHFTSYEINYGKSTVNFAARFAGLYCAKEAFLKAVGFGVGAGFKLKDIEVNHKPNGQPYYVFASNITAFLKQQNITSVALSISHTDDTSVAICMCNI